MPKRMTFSKFVFLWLLLVAVGTLIYPPIYKVYLFYSTPLFEPVALSLLGIVTQPILAMSFLVLALFRSFMFLFCCWILFRHSKLIPPVKLQDTQTAFSGIGFGALFFMFAFGMTLPQAANRSLVFLCGFVGLVVLLFAYREKRDSIIREDRSEQVRREQVASYHRLSL